MKDPEELAADAAVEALVEHPQAGKNPTPFNINPSMGRFSRLVSTVTDEAEGVDVEQEYEELEKRLSISEALTPEVIKREQNEVDRLAYAAHRLYVLARIALERFDTEAGISQAAMRTQAAVSLQSEKDAGKRSKAITDADVQQRMAELYPDEVRAVDDQKIRARKAVENLENLAERWARRSWTLSSMAGA